MLIPERELSPRDIIYPTPHSPLLNFAPQNLKNLEKTQNP